MHLLPSEFPGCVGLKRDVVMCIYSFWHIAMLKEIDQQKPGLRSVAQYFTVISRHIVKILHTVGRCTMSVHTFFSSVLYCANIQCETVSSAEKCPLRLPGINYSTFILFPCTSLILTFLSCSSFGPRINPVTGVVEEEQPNPMEGMTEEQKEYEAMKLISMFDKLSRSVKDETACARARGRLSTNP